MSLRKSLVWFLWAAFFPRSVWLFSCSRTSGFFRLSRRHCLYRLSASFCRPESLIVHTQPAIFKGMFVLFCPEVTYTHQGLVRKSGSRRLTYKKKARSILVQDSIGVNHTKSRVMTESVDSVTRYIFQPASGSGERGRPWESVGLLGWLPEETWNYTYVGSSGDNRTLKRTWSPSWLKRYSSLAAAP